MAETLQSVERVVIGALLQFIGDAGAHANVEALKADSVVSSLGIRFNQISDTGAHAIAET